MTPRKTVPVAMLVAWGVLSAGALVAGLYMLWTGREFRRTRVEAEGVVVLRPGPRGRQALHVEFSAGGRTVVVPAPRGGGYEVKAKFFEGHRVRLWYAADDPRAVSYDGDRNLYGGGIVFTAAGGLFTLAWLLLLAARLLPGGPIRFHSRQD